MSQLVLDVRPNTALFSPCDTYRYILTRELGGDIPLLSFGLNPSTATAEEDDNTIRRDIGFARHWGLGRVIKLNAYAYRATDPDDMKRAAKAGVDIVGPENDRWIRDMLLLAKMAGGRVVVSWGKHIDAKRQLALWDVLMECGIEPMCFGTNKNGTPVHELYQPYDRVLVVWRCP